MVSQKLQIQTPLNTAPHVQLFAPSSTLVSQTSQTTEVMVGLGVGVIVGGGKRLGGTHKRVSSTKAGEGARRGSHEFLKIPINSYKFADHTAFDALCMLYACYEHAIKMLANALLGLVPLFARSLLSALCSLLSALCPLLFALCPLLFALCSLPSALCPLLSVLCSLSFLLKFYSFLKESLGTFLYHDGRLRQ
jgi:hypothetical protein